MFQQIVEKIIRNVVMALYQPFWGAILMAFMSMFLYLYSKEHGWKGINLFIQPINSWVNEFLNSSDFRRVFLLAFHATMILFRTLINRQIWFDPLGKIMEGWVLYDGDGKLTTEAIENFMLFVPFTILLLWALGKHIIDERFTLRSVLWRTVKVVGSISLTIEFLQVLFHVGTFQISDLTYNTLGGCLGGMIYWLCIKIKGKGKSQCGRKG